MILQKILVEVKGGGALSGSLKRHGIFPDFLIQMAAVGEESGSLDKMLLSASEIFESEGEQMIKRLTTYIEPAATLTVGLAVGFIALAIMMPLFSMMNSLL
jgi:type II secretory pathway component PulF